MAMFSNISGSVVPLSGRNLSIVPAAMPGLNSSVAPAPNLSFAPAPAPNLSFAPAPSLSFAPAPNLSFAPAPNLIFPMPGPDSSNAAYSSKLGVVKWAYIAVIPIGVVVAIVLTVYISKKMNLKRKRRRLRSTTNLSETSPPFTRGNMGDLSTFYTYKEIKAATNGFSKDNVLGEGGFGLVYKGRLWNGQLVAVKQLKVGGAQGEQDFRTEVEVISRIHHRHLVSLVGYCADGNERFLIFDYVPNGTLAHHLHEQRVTVMEWATRLKIAIGSARGLAYLHEDCHPRIIHRDIKASNILLDDNFEAQVADFGLAKLTSDAYTHVTTRVMGTFGYLAPEYALTGMLTKKSDVYSFGVVLLELVTGQRPVDTTRAAGEENIVEWARPLLIQALDNKDLETLVDPKLNKEYDQVEILRMLEVAASCVHYSADKRPKMGQIMRVLENNVQGLGQNEGDRFGDSVIYESIFGKHGFDISSRNVT